MIGGRALGFQARHSSYLAPRAWLAFGLPGPAAPSLSLHLGVSRGDLGVHPRCSDSPPRSIRKAADAAHVPIWPTAAPLVRNSPRGWTPRSLTTIRLGERRAAAWCRRRRRPLPEHQGDAQAVAGCRLPNTFLASASASAPACLRACVPADDAAARLSSAHANLRVRESLRCPPSRRVPHKWSGRRPNKNTGRAAAFLFERGGLSEQRGWAPKALRLNPPRKPRLELAAASQGDASTRSPMNRLLRGREGVA